MRQPTTSTETKRLLTAIVTIAAALIHLLDYHWPF